LFDSGRLVSCALRSDRPKHLRASLRASVSDDTEASWSRNRWRADSDKQSGSHFPFRYASGASVDPTEAGQGGRRRAMQGFEFCFPDSSSANRKLTRESSDRTSDFGAAFSQPQPIYSLRSVLTAARDMAFRETARLAESCRPRPYRLYRRRAAPSPL